MEALGSNTPKLERVCLSGQDATAEEEGGRLLPSSVVCGGGIFRPFGLLGPLFATCEAVARRPGLAGEFDEEEGEYDG